MSKSLRIPTSVSRHFRICPIDGERVVLIRKHRDTWLFLVLGTLGLAICSLITAGYSTIWPGEAHERFGWDVFAHNVAADPGRHAFFFGACLLVLVGAVSRSCWRGRYVVGADYFERRDFFGPCVFRWWIISNGGLSLDIFGQSGTERWADLSIVTDDRKLLLEQWHNVAELRQFAEVLASATAWNLCIVNRSPPPPVEQRDAPEPRLGAESSGRSLPRPGDR